MRVDHPRDRHEILVIDDGSGDETPDVVATFQAGNPWLIYERQENSGVASARNRGARLARGDVLIFIDDDIIVPPDLVRHHLRLLEEYGDCLVNGHWEFEPGLAESLRKTPFGRSRIEVEQWVKQGVGKTVLRDHCYEPSAVTACNLGVLRESFWNIGGFDEQFPFAGCEDQEFSIRARAAGYRLVYDFNMQTLHNDGRLTLRQFCERQRRGALTAVLLALKHPGECGGRMMVVENGPFQQGDPFRRVAKKVVKQVLSVPPALALLHMLIGAMERWCLDGRLLQRLYHLAYGLYIFRGVRDGFRRFRCEGRGGDLPPAISPRPPVARPGPSPPCPITPVGAPPPRSMDIDLLLATPHYIVEKTKRDRARRWCPTLSGHVLDIGCGYSPYRHLLKHASRYTSVETEWRYRPHILALATRLPLPSESVDGAMLTEVLEHLPEPERALREVARVLRRGGRLYLTVPMTWGLHYEPHDYYRFTRFGIDHLLRKAGFQAEVIEPMGGLFTIIAARLAEYFSTLVVDRPLRWLGMERGRLRACALALSPFNLPIFYLCKILDMTWRKDVFGWAVVARKGDEPAPSTGTEPAAPVDGPWRV